MLLLLMIALVVTEFRFDWIENAVGAFLVTTNSRRPESGTIWDQGRQSDMARQTLAQYADQRQNVQREVRRATSMGQVVAGIDSERGAMISAPHFVELYLKLPPVLSHEIISPYTLLTQLSAGHWRRTFFERQGQQLSVYLLDDHSQVLHRLAVGPGLLGHIQRGEVAIHSSLYHLSDFAAFIYPAEQFFTALNALPASVRQGIIAHPEDLLRVSGRIVRVGISSDAVDGAVDLGFEVEDAEEPRVILMQGRPNDVQRLKWILEEQAVTKWSGSGEAQP
ncbi:MAG: hypothetical protein GY697_12135 [Desulfobacterales bacterium]|nr:hypothetical protein [Desulfobacterales bacterium]